MKLRGPLGRALGITLLVLSCALPGRNSGDPEVRHELQRASLDVVVRRGAPRPPPPGAAEQAAAAASLAQGDPDEAAELESYYGSQRDLLAYAIRDTDGDGIHDFRVSDYYGKFLEGDVDLDGDGLRNVIDPDPYASAPELQRGATSAPDANRNGVPDSVDWELQRGRDAAARLQRNVFDTRGILMVDRSAAFDAALARSVHDVVTRVLRSAPSEGLRAVRVVAAEKECLLFPEEDVETHAMMISQTQTLVIYESGAALSPFAQLGLLLHELAHGYQFSVDFEDVAIENRRVYFPAPGFLSRVAPFGWSHTALAPEDAIDPPRLFTPHYLLTEQAYAWREHPPEWWAEWLARLEDELGEAYLQDPRVTERDIVGGYSLQNPWEWHSDSVLAYFFVEIERWLADHPDASVARAEDMRAASRKAWPGFRYENLSHTVADHFRRVLPLLDEDLAYFAETYVTPLASGRE